MKVSCTRNYIIVLLCFWIFSVSLAQTIQIRNAENNAAIEGVLLTVSAQPDIILSDKNGFAQVTKFKSSEQILLTHAGYNQSIIKVSTLRDTTVVYLDPFEIEMEELVVSSRRWDVLSKTVPTLISKISAQDIQFNNPQTTADLLEAKGQVYIQKSQQGGGSPMIRGFATNRLLYSVDGTRMNTAIFRGGNIQNIISMDPFSVEKVDVIMGANSVLFGSDAIGGVMHFKTLTPNYSNDNKTYPGKLAVGYNTVNNAVKLHVHQSVIKSRWAALFSLSHQKYDHLRMGSFGPKELLRPSYVQFMDSMDHVISQEDPRIQIPTAYDQTNMMAKFKYRILKNTHIQLASHYSATSPYGRYDRHLRTRKGLPRYGMWNYGPQIWSMQQATFESFNQFHLDLLKCTVAYQNFKESRLSRNFGKTKISHKEENVDALSVNIDGKKRVTPKILLLGGIETVYNRVKSFGAQHSVYSFKKQEIASRYPPLSTWSTYGAYMAYNQIIGDRTSLTVGMRYSLIHIQSAFDNTYYPIGVTDYNNQFSALTGNAGVVYELTKNWSIRGNTGRAFRAPNIDDMGKVFDSEPGAVVVPNLDLKPEISYNIDIGLKYTQNKSYVDINVYYAYLDQAIVRRNYTINGQDSILYDGVLSQVQALQNAAHAKVYGLQIGSKIHWTNAFYTTGTLNIQNGVEEQDDGALSPSRHAAPIFGRIGLGYDYNKLRFELTTRFNGEKSSDQMAFGERNKTYLYLLDENGNPYAPGWTVFDFKMIRTINQLTCVAGIENILDKRYRPYSSGLVAGGRNLYISLAYTW